MSDDAPKPTLISDTECYPNFWCIGFLRPEDGKLLVIEHSVRKPMTDKERERLRAIILQNRIVGYNWIGYDNPMVWLAISGADNATLKKANDQIIVHKLKHWHAGAAWEVHIPEPWNLDIVDLIEPQPNAFAGLKTLMGRMHAKKLQDLPYSPDTELTEAEMDNVVAYMGNDLSGTGELKQALAEPLALREAMGREYGLDLMSKSDTQMGEAIFKKRVEQAIGERVYKVETPAGTTFKYPVPSYLSFEREDLRNMVDRLRVTDFVVQANGKVELPEWLGNMRITMGESAYQMGIGGLHSTESNRAVHADDDHYLEDDDVGSFYPAIILNSGLYPKALGPSFLIEFRKVRDERIAAKKTDKVKAEGLKIALNGAGFGKLGSPYSVLYAPHLLITITLTGQLALLMLIERAEIAGIPVVSANTDGVVFRCRRDDEAVLEAVKQKWMADTGFDLEATRYRSLYNQSVNSYIAVKEDGTAKLKGPLANPWRSDGDWKPDLRAQLMKNPQMPILTNAVVDLILHGIPMEQTIRKSRDVRDFVTVVKVDGGGIWNGRAIKETRVRSGGDTADAYEINVGVEGGDYLGKVVRYIWSTRGAEILKAKAHVSTGNHAKVPKTDGCRPLMELPDAFPDDIDYAAYVDAANEILMDIGYKERPPLIKPLRIFKHSAMAWFAVAV